MRYSKAIGKQHNKARKKVSFQGHSDRMSKQDVAADTKPPLRSPPRPLNFDLLTQKVRFNPNKIAQHR